MHPFAVAHCVLSCLKEAGLSSIIRGYSLNYAAILYTIAAYLDIASLSSFDWDLGLIPDDRTPFFRRPPAVLRSGHDHGGLGSSRWGFNCSTANPGLAQGQCHLGLPVRFRRGRCGRQHEVHAGAGPRRPAGDSASLLRTEKLKGCQLGLFSSSFRTCFSLR